MLKPKGIRMSPNDSGIARVIVQTARQNPPQATVVIGIIDLSPLLQQHPWQRVALPCHRFKR